MPQPPTQPESDDYLADEFDAAIAAPGVDTLGALANLLHRHGAVAHRGVREATALQGTEVGGYRLVCLIGAGGMGATYRAINSEGDQVAVKVVGALSRDRRGRFEAEWQILKKLSHPGVVRYLDHGITEDGNGYLVMEFVEGRSLQDVLEGLSDAERADAVVTRLLSGVREESEDLERSPRFRTRIMRLLASVGEALDHVHGAGVVHRDIKPANIMLRPDLTPVLIDFGLSRDLFKNVSLTRSGVVMGTLSYMAPEQLGQKDSAADARTDVFALGLVLYRALVGGDLRPDVRAVMQFERRTLSLWNDGDSRLPTDVQAILLRCLDRDPRRRYETAAKLAADLHAAAEGSPVSVRLPGVWSRLLRQPRTRFAALLILLLLVFSVLITIAARDDYYLWVDVLNDGGDLILDGTVTLKTPLDRHPIAPGEHTLEYRFEKFVPTVQRSLSIVNRFTRVNLLTNPVRDPSQIQRRFSEDPSSAMLSVRVGDPSHTASSYKLSVDSVPVEASRRWIALAPGKHTILVRSASGREESQLVDLLPAQLNFVNMLFGSMATVDGRFRYTLGHVLSPRPDHVSIKLSDGAVFYMNDARERGWAIKDPVSIALHNFITSATPGKESTAVLRVNFDEPMHSIVFLFSCDYHTDHARIRVDYRSGDLDGGTNSRSDPIRLAESNSPPCLKAVPGSSNCAEESW